jgi:hypothetical protein
VVLVVAPLFSIVMLGAISRQFSRPSAWPVQGMLALTLIAGLAAGCSGLQRIHGGRDGQNDGLGMLSLVLLLSGIFLVMLFVFCGVMLYGSLPYGVLAFGGS